MKEHIQVPKTSKITKVFYIGIMVFILFTMGLLLYVFYLIFFPPQVLVVSQPVITDKSAVVRGDTVELKIKYCKKVEAISFIVRSLVSSQKGNFVVPLTELSSTAPIGCGTFFIPVSIPTGIPAGQYRALISFQYQADAVSTVHENFASQPFEIK